MARDFSFLFQISNQSLPFNYRFRSFNWQVYQMNDVGKLSKFTSFLFPREACFFLEPFARCTSLLFLTQSVSRRGQVWSRRAVSLEAQMRVSLPISCAHVRMRLGMPRVSSPEKTLWETEDQRWGISWDFLYQWLISSGWLTCPNSLISDSYLK